MRGADMLFISHERLAQVTSVSFLDVAPALVIEVLSPGSTAEEISTDEEMERKTAEYLAAGVERVWVVDSARKAVLVHTDTGERTEEAALHGEGLLAGFVLDVAALFEG